MAQSDNRCRIKVESGLESLPRQVWKSDAVHRMESEIQIHMLENAGKVRRVQFAVLSMIARQYLIALCDGQIRDSLRFLCGATTADCWWCYYVQCGCINAVSNPVALTKLPQQSVTSFRTPRFFKRLIFSFFNSAFDCYRALN